MKKLSKVIIVILALLTVNSLQQGDERESYIYAKFQAFLKEHSKKYNTIEEYTARFLLFKTNFEKMEALSISPERKSTYNIGITKFFDLSPQEFRTIYLNLKITLLDLIKAQSTPFELNGETVPQTFDWRDEGAVNPIKDQGACGSCWAFSTVANLEGIYYVKSKKSINLCEQQLIDCDSDDNGCDGGLMENALKYVKTNGLGLSKDYPYKAKKGTCKKVHPAIHIKGFHFAPSQDEESIKEMLVKTGPLSIAINAEPLQFYSSGIIDANASECDPQGLNHGVAIVGYGSEQGNSYWVIRNSWGENWGEEGYFRIALGKGICGVNSYVITGEIK